MQMGKTDTDCEKHQVTIGTGQEGDRPTSFCGPDFPVNYTMRLAKLVIKVSGTEFSNEDGFSITYNSSKCLFPLFRTFLFQQSNS